LPASLRSRFAIGDHHALYKDIIGFAVIVRGRRRLSPGADSGAFAAGAKRGVIGFHDEQRLLAGGLLPGNRRRAWREVMISLLLGVILGLLVGALCRWFDLPSPTPPTPVGALLVVAMTLGYVVAGQL
jgi:XapX domain-containing protein